ncbi:MAG TPA: HYR domain-containing protein [Pirellulaceae bacterium]|jgi:hypothetical protein|nr:HYR domain-containing protein [Pirellulaceae bacterium]
MKLFANFARKALICAAFAVAAAASTASAQTYYDGFEDDPTTWVGADRVPTGTNGVDASEGAFYGAPTPGVTSPFTRFGGYNVAFPSHGFDTSVDIYLNVEGAFANDTQLDYTAAISTPTNAHRRDFIFNLGFYDDATGPAPNTNRFVVSASNNSGGADPKNPARSPIAISTTGWYTFKHEFRKTANNVLTVRLAIIDAVGAEVGSWTLSDPSDVIGVTVGGNRYGWFPVNQFGSSLYFDESRKQNAPQPDFRGYFVDVSEWSSSTVRDAANGIYPIGGSGQLNGNFVVEQKRGVQIGIRASKRSAVPNTLPTYRDGEVGVYLADPGKDLLRDPNLSPRAAWNWDIHADLRNATGVYEGTTLDDYDLLLDTDIGNPLFGQQVPIHLEEGFPEGGPGAILFQTSQNPLFGQDPATPFDINVERDYFLKLTLVPKAFQAEPLQVEIRVDVTDEKSGLPKVDAIGVKSIEPGEGFNRVTLYTIIEDPDNDPLLVEWKVDGAVEQSEVGVLSGTTVEFAFDFPLGSSNVSVEVSDPENTVIASTTVTVSDAVGPVVVVAPNVVVPTDPGVDFATGVTLTEPTVVDAFDGNPTLTNDAPAQFPLGDTIVTWTATDASGNVTTATQTVTVEDRESPRIESTPAVVTSVDKGQVFAKFNLEEPSVRDNVEVVSLTNDAPKRFPVGKTQVNWTAVDAAGNFAVRTQVVVVKNVAPVAEAGSLIRVEANSKSGARVRLDARGSSDEDGHKLTFSWTANGVNFSKRTSARPVGKFPVGKTVARVVVTDEVGATSTDTVTVIVSFDQKLVADTRPFSGFVTPYVDASVSTLGAYADQNPTNDALVYTAAFAEYAKIYDLAANDVRYRDGKLSQQTDVYLSLRYYQVYFSANAATYAYLGGGATDGYYHAAAAEYYGQADLDD